MRRRPIAVVVSTILAASLAGCNSATDTAATPPTPATEATAQSHSQASARVTFSATFPAAAQAQTAVIDAETTTILIQIYATEVSSWSDYFGQQTGYGGYYDGYGGYYEGEATSGETLVSELYLDASSPSQSVSLIPGPYRISASQFDAAGLESRIPISEAVTLGELVSGENNIVLNMLHGTWTFKDESGAETPLALQLLGRTDLVDTDPETAEQEPLDWDPSTPDTVESAADILGLNGTTIKGLHLIGLQGSELFDGYGGYEASSAAAQYAALPPVVAVSRYGHYTLLRQDDGAGAEVVAESPLQPYGKLCNSSSDSCTEWEAPSGLGLVLHEFDGASGTNTAQVDLGSANLSTGIYNPESDSWNGFGAGLFTISRYEMTELIDGGYGGLGNEPNEPVDDGTNIVYTLPTDERSYQWQSGYYDESGNYQTLYLARFSTSGETLSHTNAESPLFDLVSDTVAPDGSTITGTIIEYVTLQSTPVLNNGGGYSGTEAPPYSGPAPASAQSTTTLSRIAAIKRALALDEIAIKAGLKAQSANANGSNCRTLTVDEQELNANYGWDAESGQWIAGEYNYTFYWNNGVAAGEDWDGDGTPEPFETGVIYNTSYWQEWDPVNQLLIARGDDLDGDGTPEKIEQVEAHQRSSSSLVEVCVHPFILKGEQLTYVTDTTVEVTSK